MAAGITVSGGTDAASSGWETTDLAGAASTAGVEEGWEFAASATGMAGKEGVDALARDGWTANA